MRKTQSEPSSFHFSLDVADLELRSSHNAPTLDADYEAELVMQQQRCEAEVVRVLDHLEPSSYSFISLSNAPEASISERSQSVLGDDYK